MLEMKTLYINTKNTYYLVLAGCYLSLLSGCTYSVKPSELRNDVKPIEYSSTKTAKVLALCIQDEWEAINNNLMKIQIKEKTNGYSVWVEQSIGSGSPLVGYLSMKDSATFIADIDNSKNGSTVQYYSVFTYKEEWISAVKDCLTRAYINNGNTIENNISNEQQSNTTQKLKELNELRKSGLITDDDFQNKKKALLDKM